MEGRLAVLACSAAALAGVTVSAVAATPKPTTGAYYEGKAAPGAVLQSGSPYANVRLRLSNSGKTVDVRGPSGGCRGVGGSGPFPSFFGRIREVAAGRDGKFSGKESYEIPVSGKKLFWTIEVSGRFVSAKAAKGTITYEMQYERSDRPARETCGKKSGTWSAKLCTKCKGVLGYKQPKGR